MALQRLCRSLRSCDGAAIHEYVLLTAMLMVAIPAVGQLSINLNNSLAQVYLSLTGRSIFYIGTHGEMGEQTASAGGTAVTNPGGISTGPIVPSMRKK